MKLTKRFYFPSGIYAEPQTFSGLLVRVSDGYTTYLPESTLSDYPDFFSEDPEQKPEKIEYLPVYANGIRNEAIIHDLKIKIGELINAVNYLLERSGK